MHELVYSLIPTKADQFLMGTGAVIGAVFGWATGSISDSFYWLCAFVVVDYATGMTQAIKNHDWSSSTGFKGLMKKVILLMCAILGHGLADVAGVPAIETAVIFAFAVNEAGSVLENVERCGWGNLIPPMIRAALKVAQSKEDELEKNLEAMSNDHQAKN